MISNLKTHIYQQECIKTNVRQRFNKFTIMQINVISYTLIMQFMVITIPPMMRIGIFWRYKQQIQRHIQFHYSLP
ncbi:unnamed protein product [Paramecium octaurelia]|uniref:Transmembrane protein n=1 Tax=Paramecium octaurelia TaxID=43137 RepID=A0A8S1RSG8_PAROT|nr:unnamed protein product [Paramecium octaurelia]